MKRLKKVISVSCVLSLAMTSVAMADKKDTLQQSISGYNTNAALNFSDQYAWQLFTDLNHPADLSNCGPARHKALGDDGLTVWEVWQSREETFLDGAVRPPRWREGCNDGGFYSYPEGNYSNFDDEAVRINKKAYRFIRSKQLYSLDEQERLAQDGVTDIDFPLGSKTVKAGWVKIEEADKPFYHWVEVERDDEVIIFGLSAIHIASKDFPTWFWATFEHVDNNTRWNLTYPEAFPGWVVPSKDSAACPPSNLACNQIPEGYGLEGTKWENYRLRGTQTEIVDNRGNPTILVNSHLEGVLDQESMSCISCHALAVKGESGDSMPIPITEGTNENGLPMGHIGALNPTLFLDNNGSPIPYVGLDYVWTLRNAKRENF
ncbi:hypothetical protein ACFOEK_01395 [Litoribrevibacter euphylliae]|uniref:Cytochrome c domain-containing protein n=1 Tax=Litoribrevibacter euphylliae TaxID=1834034 RepID=A0ABV7HAJ2_9GAMM